MILNIKFLIVREQKSFLGNMIYILVIILITIYFSYRIISKSKKYILMPVGRYGMVIPSTTWEENSNNTFIIAALGDSFTQGYPDPKKFKPYPFFLEMKLNSSFKDKVNYKVLNFGEGGTSMMDKVKIFKQEILKIRPNLLILQYLDDDIQNTTRIREIFCGLIEYRNCSELGEDKSILNTEEFEKRYELYMSKAYALHGEELASRPFEEVWKNNIEVPLDELVEIARTHKIKILLVNIPCLPKIDFKQLSLLKKYIAKKNLSFLDLTSTFLKYDIKNLTISSVDCHPTVFAHKLIANEIYKKLISDNLIPT